MKGIHYFIICSASQLRPTKTDDLNRLIQWEEEAFLVSLVSKLYRRQLSLNLNPDMTRSSNSIMRPLLSSNILFDVRRLTVGGS